MTEPTVRTRAAGLVSWPIARATVRERATAPFTLVCFVVIVLLGFVHNQADAWGAEAFSNVAAIWFFLLVLALSAGLLSSEVESGHAQLVLLRPITRASWVSGRLVGAGFLLCLGGVAGWVVNLAAAMARGEPLEFLPRLLVLPLAILPALAWLATAIALSAVMRGFSNAVVLLGARAIWAVTLFGTPVLFPKLPVGAALAALDPYVGPQKLFTIVDQVRAGEPVIFSPALWDLFWLLAAWTCAVWLFNRRELARRRA
ncbi:MAG TPA: ABC transporter permease [Myxococcales bacterium]|jgi:ABC-type transport system involved in multi-copper enzyme maturation permease subunit